MPESIETYAARIAAAQGDDGRLPLDPDGMPTWETFPVEAEALRLKPLGPLAAAESAREGDDPATCHCATGGSPDWPVVWTSGTFNVKVAPPSGAPVILIAEPVDHLDIGDLSAGLAADLGRLTVALIAGVEALPSVGRCHVGRWGDGGAHGHVWFIARPARMPRLRGTLMALWDDLLPPVPVAVRDENAAFVIDQLVAAYGGERVG